MIPLATLDKKTEDNTTEITVKVKTPTMKKWGYASWTVTIVVTFVTIYCCVMCLGDTSTLGTLCALCWGETGVYTGCYAYKSKAENKLKITQGFIAETADKYGIEAITPIIQTILGD